MKAGFLESIRKLVVKEVSDPVLETGSALVKVTLCSVCASDLRVYEYGNPRVKLPHILGHEIVGEISAVTSDVRGYKVGDRVAITPRVTCGRCLRCREGQPIYCQDSATFGFQLPGGFAEYVLVPRSGLESGVLQPVADLLTDGEAALAEPLSCCLRGQKLSRVSRGDTVVVIGGGPVGLMHCRLARTMGARRVVLVERQTSRLAAVKLDSVDAVVNANHENVKSKVFEVNAGRGADVVIVACSSVQAQEQALSLTRKGARVNFFGGLPAGESAICIDTNFLHYQEISLQGTHSSVSSDHREALDLLAGRVLRVDDLMSDIYPLDRLQEAFDFAESRKAMHVGVKP